jgi:glutaredoxin-like protein
MAALSKDERQQISEHIKEVQNPVKLVHFTQELDCELCPQTRDLLEDVALLSDKLSLEIYNSLLDKEKVAQYGISKVPATVIEGEKDYGIRLYGLPAGYEFAVLLLDILQVSRRNSGLRPESVEKLRNLAQPLHLEVFVTPMCPYCPGAVRIAHQLAIESDLITADMVEATEYPELVRRYAVRGVPKTVINGSVSIDGSLPESDYVDEVVNSIAALGHSVVKA